MTSQYKAVPLSVSFMVPENSQISIGWKLSKLIEVFGDCEIRGGLFASPTAPLPHDLADKQKLEANTNADIFQMTSDHIEGESQWPEWLRQAREKGSNHLGAISWDEDRTLWLNTHQGPRTVLVGDYIIRSEDGGLILCPPNAYQMCSLPAPSHDLHRYTTNDIAKADDMGHVSGKTEWIRVDELEALHAQESELRETERRYAVDRAKGFLSEYGYYRDGWWRPPNASVRILATFNDAANFLESLNLLYRHESNPDLVRLTPPQEKE